jgi:hypothetical protein
MGKICLIYEQDRPTNPSKSSPIQPKTGATERTKPMEPAPDRPRQVIAGGNRGVQKTEFSLFFGLLWGGGPFTLATKLLIF